MGDVFLECMVKKKTTTADMLLKALFFAVGILIFAFAFTLVTSQYFGAIAFLIGVGAIYFAWYFATSLSLEYEYIFTNGEIDIDKISAKRKRKRMITVKVSAFNDFDKFNASTNDLSQYEVKYDAAASHTDPATYYATFTNREGKRCILLFTPDERVLEAINAVYRKKPYAHS